MFLLVENAEKENPGEFGHILQRPGAVAAPHYIADRFHGGIDRLLGVQPAAVAVGSVSSSSHVLPHSVENRSHQCRWHSVDQVEFFACRFKDRARNRQLLVNPPDYCILFGQRWNRNFKA